MELGNMIFGNSRGEHSIPRTAAFEGPWEELIEALEISWRGYAERENHPLDNGGNIENDVFRIMAYDWDADCDCGADNRMDAWFKKHPHGNECYQTELHSRLKSWEDRSGYAAAEAVAFGRDDNLLRGFASSVEEVEPGVTFMSFEPRSDAAMNAWRGLGERRRKVEEALYAELGAKHGVDPHYGAAVHCTCGRDTRADEFWTAMGGHEDDCRLIQPNFLYKPTGFRINWYKYPFRDSYMTPKISAKKWREIVRHCIESAGH
jgi:hypothetical protein